ncbi:hypothetical protein [Streptomyces sp. WMMB 322]|uniref:hypothetical protein n=1 Tax=Streptomyces sp. WMMB 322 TaxID=1286821 RepID=UPI0006E334FD|nr:hypothetical protein [Streptomyces sp. WMMB 322]SCK33006.1 hypothetical protein H180DRAFT_02660 [Streptomyces sp. WMMB 322]
MESEPRLPLAAVAFDDPATQATWKATRRRVVLKLSLWSVLFVAAFVVSGVFAEVRLSEGDGGRYGRGGNSVGGLIGAVAVLAYPFALYTCCGALSRLRKARSVLEAYPWRSLPAVRKLTGTKEAMGVPVQFGLPDDAGAEAADESAYVDDDGSVWSQTMSARNPLRWNRWDESMERGAWFAGDIELGGVLALPGGRGLMTVQRRTQVLSMERKSAKADHARLLAAAPGRG